jgi:hypothetical protein
MSPLQVQKQLLIAESELNRALLATELVRLGDGVTTIAAGVTRVEMLLSSLVTVVAGLLHFGRTVTPGADKPSLLSMVIKGGSLIASLWKTFKS